MLPSVVPSGNPHNYTMTPEGYLLRASVEGGQPFRPHLFEGLEINLAALLGEGVSQTE